MAVSTIKKPILFETKVVRYLVENIQIPKSDLRSGDREITGTPGYTPIGVIGWNVYGENGSWLNVNQLRVANGKLEWCARNISTTSATNATLVAEVLFVKDS